MTIAIIKSVTDDDGISNFVENMVCTAILSSNNSYRICDVGNMELKSCTQKDCLERDFDRTVKFGCKKYSTCIDEQNGSIIENICNEISSCEAFVFLIQEKRYSSKLSQFINGFSKKESACRLEGKKCLLLLLSDEDGYSFGLNELAGSVEKRLSNILKMKVVDAFLFDKDTGNYMMEVIPFAIRTYVTNIKKIEQQFIDHKKMVRFNDMHDLSPEILYCLNQSGIFTVGELSEKNGNEIFEILGKVYDRVAGLLLAYFKNKIPIDLLNDLIIVADDYRKAAILEYDSKLKKIGEGLRDIKEKVVKLDRIQHENE